MARALATLYGDGTLGYAELLRKQFDKRAICLAICGRSGELYHQLGFYCLPTRFARVLTPTDYSVYRTFWVHVYSKRSQDSSPGLKRQQACEELILLLVDFFDVKIVIEVEH